MNQIKTPFDFCGLVLDYDEVSQIATIQQRNYFKLGQEIEFLDLRLKTSLKSLIRYMMKMVKS